VCKYGIFAVTRVDGLQPTEFLSVMIDECAGVQNQEQVKTQPSSTF